MHFYVIILNSYIYIFLIKLSFFRPIKLVVAKYSSFFSPIKLVVAKCWDPNPTGYFTIPRTEPVRPIDPGAWVAHIEATRGELFLQ